MKIRKDLYNSWDTIDEAIDYFLDLVLDLKALKRMPNPPSDLFTYVTNGGKELDDEIMDDIIITLESLEP